MFSPQWKAAQEACMANIMCHACGHSLFKRHLCTDFSCAPGFRMQNPEGLVSQKIMSQSPGTEAELPFLDPSYLFVKNGHQHLL